MAANWRGTSWRIGAVGGRVLEGEATLALTIDGRVSGRAVINQFSGVYLVDDGALVVGPLAVTQMAGPAAAMAEERAVLQALAEPLRVQDQPSPSAGDRAGVGDALVVAGPSTSLLLIPTS